MQHPADWLTCPHWLSAWVMVVVCCSSLRGSSEMTAKYSEIWQASNHAGSLIPGMVWVFTPWKSAHTTNQGLYFYREGVPTQCYLRDQQALGKQGRKTLSIHFYRQGNGFREAGHSFVVTKQMWPWAQAVCLQSPDLFWASFLTPTL
jgi:hypothetical protein